MKGYKFLSLISLGLGLQMQAAWSQTSVIQVQGAPSSLPSVNLPILLKMEESMATNANKVQSSFGNTFSHGLTASTEYINKFSSSGQFSLAPTLKGTYAPGEKNDLSTFKATNKLSVADQLTEATRGTISSEHGYINEFSITDRQEFQKNQYYYANLEGLVEQKIIGGLSVNFRGGGKFEDYMTPSSVTNPNENDNMKVYGEVTPILAINENALIKMPVIREHIMARTKKSLLSTGAEGGKLAETLDYTKIRLIGEFRMDGLTLTPQVGYHTNKDEEFGAKNYKGTILGVKLGFDTDSYGFSTELLSTDQGYINQLSDVKGTALTSPQYDYNLLEVKNALILKRIMQSSADLGFGYEMEQTSSNRSTVDYTNHVFKLNLSFSL